MDEETYRRRVVNLLGHLRGISLMLLGVGFGVLAGSPWLRMDDEPGIGGLVFLAGAVVGIVGLIATARVPVEPRGIKSDRS